MEDLDVPPFVDDLRGAVQLPVEEGDRLGDLRRRVESAPCSPCKNCEEVPPDTRPWTNSCFSRADRRTPRSSPASRKSTKRAGRMGTARIVRVVSRSWTRGRLAASHWRRLWRGRRDRASPGCPPGSPSRSGPSAPPACPWARRASPSGTRARAGPRARATGGPGDRGPEGKRRSPRCRRRRGDAAWAAASRSHFRDST